MLKSGLAASKPFQMKFGHLEGYPCIVWIAGLNLDSHNGFTGSLLNQSAMEGGME